MEATHRYMRLAIAPCCTDVLRIRQTLQDALTEMFGLTCAGTYVDVLSVSTLGSETVVRVRAADATRLLAAIAGASRGSVRCAVLKDSFFLPALASDDLGAP